MTTVINGDIPSITFTDLTTQRSAGTVLTNYGVIRTYDYTTPVTGFNYTIPANVTVAIMQPAGTLATGTVKMPASAIDGMTVTVSCTQIITALTLSANTGQSVVNPVTTLAAGATSSYLYRATNTTWYKVN